MATAGSLVVNVSADASKLESGFERARKASKGFANDTIKDLNSITKQAAKFEKMLNRISNANVGTIAGGLLGGAAGGFIGGQLDEMLKFSDTFDLNPIKNFQEIMSHITGELVAQEKANFATHGASVAEGIQKQTDALQAKRIELEQGTEAARKYQALADLNAQVGGNITIEEAKIARQNIEARLKEQEVVRQQLQLEEQINKARQERAAREDKAAQTLHGLRQQVDDLNKDDVQKKLAQLERGGLNKPELAQAQRHLQEIAAFQQREQMATHIQDVMRQQDAEVRTPFGPSGALRAGSSEAFSAEQKAKRMVEANGRAGQMGTAAERAVKIQEKILDEEKAAKKQREDIKKAIEDNAKLKVLKF